MELNEGQRAVPARADVYRLVLTPPPHPSFIQFWHCPLVLGLPSVLHSVLARRVPIAVPAVLALPNSSFSSGTALQCWHCPLVLALPSVIH